ncbi:transcriptional regulator [Clostridium diolis]|uniref:helix-turn-helix domain-containing protein n=1 Tax=Clostridium diolis TaxID=223919 RepID=UPI000B404DC1|nr:helix-turn-helix transcriptional regulator [Clostridium diolis]OVE67973.1 transcriptional regulator [Clostridium diolis]
MNLGERLKNLRLEKGISQKDLAHHFNIARSTLSQYESNQRTPSDEIKVKLSEYFNVSLDYLLGKTNVRNYTEDSNITIALHSDTDYDDLPKEAKDEINNFIEYIKQKYKDKK